MSSIKRFSQSGVAQIAVLAVLVVGVFAMLFFGMKIGTGDYQEVYIWLVLLIGVPIVMAIGDRYWLFIPFATTAAVPAIPLFAGRAISLGELWVIVCVGLFCLRLSLQRRGFRVFEISFLPFYAYAAWAAMVFLMNPVGFAILGSGNVGARHYLKIFLAVACFFILANKSVTEKASKWMIFFLLFGGLAGSLYYIYAYQFRVTEVDPRSAVQFYSWHQGLRYFPLAACLLIFCRWSNQEIFRRPLLVLALVVIAGLLLVSGKREAVASFLIFSAAASWIKGERVLVFLVGALGALVMFGAALGHGNIVELPKAVQRSIGFLPGNWDSDVEFTLNNSFRETLRRLAIERIEESPLIGEGFGVEVEGFGEHYAWSEGDHARAFLEAAGSAWHNVWLGISADFGIPAAFLFGVLWLFVLARALSVLRRTSVKDWRNTLALMIFVTIVADIITSWIGGHAAEYYWNVAWQFGIITGIENSLAEEKAVQTSQNSELEVGRLGMVQAS